MDLIVISRKIEDLLLLLSDKQIDGGCWWLLVVFINMGMNQRIWGTFVPDDYLICGQQQWYIVRHRPSSFVVSAHPAIGTCLGWKVRKFKLKPWYCSACFQHANRFSRGKAWVAATIPTFRRRFEATGSSRLSPMFKGALEKSENWHSTHGCEGKSAGNPWFKPQTLWASVNYLFLLTVNQLR